MKPTFPLWGALGKSVSCPPLQLPWRGSDFARQTRTPRGSEAESDGPILLPLASGHPGQAYSAAGARIRFEVDQWAYEVTTTGPFDARAVANLLLDRADQRLIPISNLALQKLLYFAHGAYLTRTTRPLVSGYFEAWDNGPVHPDVYRAFKVAGFHPITFRAERVDLRTRTSAIPQVPPDRVVEDIVEDVLKSLGLLDVRRLVDLSHAPRGPWAEVWNEARTRQGTGLRISDSIIRERFRFHKASLTAALPPGDPPLEDSPPT